MPTPNPIPTALLLLALAVLPLAPARAQDSPLTARQVIERIQEQVGVPWSEPTVDTFKAGDPDTPVTGIATTMMATLDVLQRAAAAGHNLIITHEPTFYGHYDQTRELQEEGDAVLAAKLAFIREHGLVVWRFHDYWHRRDPDGILTGMVSALGWEAYQAENGDPVFVVPETTLADLAAEVEDRLDVKTMRVVGDPGLSVTKVGFAAGFPGFAPQRHLLQRDDVEVLVMGEAHEWETIEYAADAVAAGLHKALIVTGHVPSEQAGMEECARWLKTFVTEAPVEFIPTLEPFWAPE